MTDQKFPADNLNLHEEGDLRFAIGEVDDKVVLNFPAPVALHRLTPKQAMKLAGALVAHAKSMARKRGETLVSGL